ncbi:MAG TPA: NAD(+)/NADH kinase [Candidatus Baltobacteraceae bacterium]|jgi:NAD+ kinase
MAHTVAFYIDLTQESARRVATEATSGARDAGYNVALCDGQDATLRLADKGTRVEDADYMVAIGGDGTLLRAARIAYPFDIPLLGINTGRLGFLTELELDGDGRMRTDLKRVLEDRSELVIEERAALEAQLPDGKTHVALNDVVVHKGDASRIDTFSLSLDGEHVADLPSDGVVVSTATGSTAYFLSAGGPIISPQVDAFGIAALLPHTLFARPLIVPTNSTIEICVDSESIHANLEADGEMVANLSPRDRVIIRRAAKPVRFAHRGKQRYFSRLEQKLRWGVSIRGTSR